ncbi:MAG TPA: sensor histidine kinase, partial [Clostridiales bacterium]|nr:sensor histidine kinase [Clostridiales bacterium]
SHDLRTPLTGIIGASAAIEENGDRIGAAETKKLAADIHEDAEWLLRMVENLLSVTRVSQVSRLKKSEEPAEEVISEAVARCHKRYPDAQIRVHLPDEMLFVPMDVTLIVQVLINLIENAVRYGGTPVDVSLYHRKGKAEFVVRDFGPGIPPDKRDTLFESAQVQADSRRGGLGIGLTLCRSILAAHDGEIDEINHPDGGAQFVFTLPLEEEI